MHLITDANDNEPGFVKAIPVRMPDRTRYKLGDGHDGVIVVHPAERLFAYRDTYRGYTISYDPPPIPIRAFDYQFAHRDYDGPGDSRCGAAESVLGCRVEIDIIEDKNA